VQIIAVSIVDLFLISESESFQDWSMGEVVFCSPNPQAFSSIVQQHLSKTKADALLFWDSSFPLPSTNLVEQLLSSTSDVWHAGLKLGLSGKPEIINYVSPTWMLNRDPDPDQEATSWRLSLRACLFRTEVLRQMGGPDPAFETLDCAGLELGFRCIRAGVFMRYVPDLLPTVSEQHSEEIPLLDQLRFVRLGFDRKWVKWASFRRFFDKPQELFSIIRAQKEIQDTAVQKTKTIYKRTLPDSVKLQHARVSVLIPTIRRYPYLRTLLSQLREQTIIPHEIIVVDQTPQSERDLDLPKDFGDLPVRWIYLDQAGQCSSRNKGLKKASGDFILFVDDDDEVPPDLIERHLENLFLYQCSVSSGVALEPGQKELPEDFRFLRLSDVFPTNNTMIRKGILEKSGLFDLAYDHGQRADHDLGMRLYLAGEMMVLDPSICVLHHHAPMGGLREHKARVDTYAKSRTSVSHFSLLTVSDLYLAKRYFTPSQVKHMQFINLLGTFSFHGSGWRKFAKAWVALFSLPKNIHILNKRGRVADQWLHTYPQIPFEQLGDLP